MHSTEGWGSVSLQRQHTFLHLAMVLHPFLAFELCGFFETLLLEFLLAAALYSPLAETKERAACSLP